MSIRQGKKLIASSTTNGFSLFDCKWADHILNNISWLRADTFSWQSGNVYIAAYEHLLSDFENRSGEMFYAWRSDQYGYYLYTTTTTPDSTTVFYDEDFQVDTEHTFSYFDGGILYLDDRPEPEISFQRDPSKDTIAPSVDTVGDITITYYLAEDGHKICLPDQEANLSSLYESTGVAWYYILDTENKQFKLPITKFGFTGIRSGVGEYVAPGLPNITGRTGATCANATPSGAFKRGTYAQTIGGGGGTLYQDNFNASWSNPIYGASDTVQPPATQMYLYFYVGNFEQSAVEQTAGLNVELFNGKADVDLNNINPSNSAKATIVGWGMPDYSAAVSMSSGSSAPKNGWAIAHGLNATITYSVNGVSVAQGNWASGNWSGNWNLQIMVSAGDVVTGGSWKFIPCKGVN